MENSIDYSTIVFRQVESRDRSFLIRLYATTRESELAQTQWTEQQKATFIEMQFTAQDTYYRNHYEGAEFNIIEWRGRAVGRYYRHETAQDVRIMEITLLPEFRGRGLGSQILRMEIDSAHTCGRQTSLHVESFNPAKRLFDRLGFRTERAGDVYHYMERKV